MRVLPGGDEGVRGVVASRPGVVDSGTVSVPDRFVATVMSRVRRIAQSPRHAISPQARGATVVTSWVLGLIAATATRDTPGVAAVTGRRQARTAGRWSATAPTGSTSTRSTKRPSR